MLLRLSRYVLALALLAPMIVAKTMFFPFISGKAIYFRTVTELALCLFILHFILSPDRKAQFAAIWKRWKHPLVVSAAAFAIIFAFTALVSINPTQAFWSNFERGEGAFQILHYVTFFLLLVALYPRESQFRWLLKINIGTSIWICGYALIQYLGYLGVDVSKWGVVAQSYRVSGTLGNPSYLAAYLLFNLAFIFYFILRKKEVVGRSLLVLLFLFESYILFRTETRGAFVGLVVGLLVIFLTNLITTKSRRLRLALFTLLTLGAASGILFFSTSSAPFWNRVPLLSRFTNLQGVGTEFGPRLWTWGSAAKGVLERPILGWGAENFPIPFDQFYNPNHFGIESFFDRTHNVFLEYLISGGIFLLLAYLAIFFFYYRMLRTKEKNFWYSILLAVPIAYLIQGFFLFDVLPIYLILFLFLAFSLSSHEAAGESEGADYRLNPLSVIGTIGIVALVSASIVITDIRVYQKNQLLTAAFQTQDPSAAVVAFEKALHFNSVTGQEETISSFNKFIIQVLEAAASQNKGIPKDSLRYVVDEANQWYDQNKAIFSGIKDTYLNAGLNIRAGISFSQTDYLERGKSLLNNALLKNPTRIELVEILLETAQAEKDKTNFDRLVAIAKSLRPDIAWPAFRP